MLSQASIFQSISIGMGLMLVGFVLTCFIKDENTNYVRKLFLGAFVVRALSVYLIYFYLQAIGGDGFAFVDDTKYDTAGRAIAVAINRGGDGYGLYSYQQNVGYFYFSGWLYSILGPDTLSARMINAFLGAFTAVLVFLITRKLYGQKYAKIAGILAAFLPNMVYWSALQFKDAALIFFTMLLTYLVVVRLRGRISILPFVGMLLAAIALWFLRKDFCLPLIGVVAIWFLMTATGLESWVTALRRKRITFIAAPVVIILIIGVLGGLGSTQIGETFIDRYKRLSQIDVATSSQNTRIVNRGSARIGFSRYLRVNSAIGLFKLPFAMGFTIMMPLPAWSALTNQNLGGFALYSVSNIIFLLLVPFVVVGLVRSSNLAPADALIVRWFPFIILIGITIMFMGVLRYKEQLMPFFVMWAALAIYERKKYRRSLLALYLVGLIGVIAAVILALILRQ